MAIQRPTGDLQVPSAGSQIVVAATDLTITSQAAEALGHDTHPGGERLRRYWTEGPGLARWDESPDAFTTLRDLLVEKAQVPAEVADRWAAAWFKQVKGYWPGSHLNKAAHDLSPAAGEHPEVPGHQVARAVRAAAEEPDRSGIGLPAGVMPAAAVLTMAAAGTALATGAALAGAETEEEKRKRDGRAAAR